MNKLNYAEAYLAAAKAWYEGERAKSGAINTNVMNAGLIVSRMMADGMPITDERLYSEEKAKYEGSVVPPYQRFWNNMAKPAFLPVKVGVRPEGLFSLLLHFGMYLTILK
jgi:hypothetical protein